MKYSQISRFVHDPEDNDKVEALKASIMEKGWVGAPIVMFDDIAISGMHRTEACRKIEEETGEEFEFPTIDIAEIFAEDGADWEEAVEDYSDAYDWFQGVCNMLEYLSDEAKDKYGINYR